MGIARPDAAEARERIEAHFEVFAKWMRDRGGQPEMGISEGDPVDEIMAKVNETGNRRAVWAGGRKSRGRAFGTR